MGSKSHFLTKCLIILFFFQLNSKLIQQWKAIDQQNRSIIVMLTCIRHTAKDILKLTNFLKQQFIMFLNDFKEETKVDRKEHKTQSDSKCIPRFLIGLNTQLKLTHPHPIHLLQRNAMCPFLQCLELSTVLFLTIQFSVSHLFAHSLNVKQFYLTHR